MMEEGLVSEEYEEELGEAGEGSPVAFYMFSEDNEAVADIG